MSKVNTNRFDGPKIPVNSLVAYLAKRSNMTDAEVRIFLGTYNSIILELLGLGYSVPIMNLGYFEIRHYNDTEVFMHGKLAELFNNGKEEVIQKIGRTDPAFKRSKSILSNVAKLHYEYERLNYKGYRDVKGNGRVMKEQESMIENFREKTIQYRVKDLMNKGRLVDGFGKGGQAYRVLIGEEYKGRLQRRDEEAQGLQESNDNVIKEEQSETN